MSKVESIIFFSDILTKIILPRGLVTIDEAKDGSFKFNFLVIDFVRRASIKLLEQRPLYEERHLDDDLLRLLMNLVFSKEIADAFEYFRDVHPTREEVSVTYPDFMYRELIKILFDSRTPARLIFGYRTNITVIPKNRIESGLASAFLLIYHMLDGIVKFVQKTEEKTVKEIIERFYEQIQANPIHNTIINEYLRTKEEYLQKIADLKREENKDLAQGPRGTIPTRLIDFYITPCIKEMIERGLKGINLAHKERVILLQLLKYFLDDKDIHKFFSYQPDYDWGITQRMIDHNRGKGYLSYNCESIIYWRFCPCGGPKGCCGTKIYSAYRFPDEVYERVKKYRGER